MPSGSTQEPESAPPHTPRARSGPRVCARHRDPPRSCRDPDAPPSHVSGGTDTARLRPQP